MAFDLTRFNSFVSEGRIIRNAWEDQDDQGRDTACLIAALAPGMRPSNCPADLMPAWLAKLTPSFDDYGSLDKWPAMIQRYAALANRWHVLDEAAWRRCLLRTLRAILDIAQPHDTSGSCSNVIAHIDREMNGDAPAQEEWKAAKAAAGAARAAWEAAKAGAEAEAEAAAKAAAGAARAAWEAAWEAKAGAEAVAARAAWEAEAEAGAEAAEAAPAAKAAAWDTITDACLSAIEGEIALVEAGR